MCGWGILLLLIFPCSLFALDPAKNVLQYNCQNWTRANGLPAGGINAIAQTDDGFLWVGTQMGLVRFDGLEFRLFKLPNQLQFRNQVISALAGSKGGGLWFGIRDGSFGLYREDTGFSSFESESWMDPLMNVLALGETPDGALWVGSGKGAARMLRGDSRESRLYEQISSVTVIFTDSRGRVWLGTAEQGLYYWNAGALTAFPDASLAQDGVLALTEDSLGQLWVGTRVGLRCYDTNLQPRQLPLSPVEIKALLTDRHGVVWMGTTGEGLRRYKDGRFTSFRKVDGLADDTVTALFEDQEGSLWLGTRNGLSQLSDVKFPIYSTAEGIDGGMCHGVRASAKGGLWVATSRGVVYYDGREGSLYALAAGLSNPYIKRVFEARNGDIYLINGNKEVEIMAEGKVVARHANTNWPTAFAEDDQSVVVSVGGALFRVNRSGLEPYAYAGDAPPLFWVRSLFTCRDGSILIACVNGVFRLKDGAFQHWSSANGLAHSDVLWVYEDSEGVLWAGQRTAVARIKDGIVRNITREDGLFDNLVSACIADDRGWFWMNSSRGIFRVHGRQLNEFADGRAARIECEAYDGLESVKTVDTTEVEFSAVCRTADGRIWIPSPQGVIMIDPANLPTNSVAPAARIQQIVANGEEFAGSRNLMVHPGRGELEVRYSAASFIAPQKVQFRYRLDGYDRDWVPAKDRRSAFYANLKPGPYHFQVQACNADGVWNTAGDGIQIELRPHFHQTALFRGLCGLLAIAGLAGAYRWRVKHLQRKQRSLHQANELLESKVNERTRELAEQRNMLRTLIDTLPDNIFVKDTQGRVLIDNVAHAQSLGVGSPEMAVGKTDFDCFPAELANKFFAGEQELLRSGEAYNAEEVSVNRSTGKFRWSRTTKVPLRDSQGQIIGIAGINRDITERKDWEVKLETLHKQLVEASRHAGMAEVATSVLHNVGNVLNSVNVSASIVEERTRKSGIDNLAKLVALLQEHRDDLAGFLAQDDKGQRVISFLDVLAQHLAQEKTVVLQEVRNLVLNIEHIKDIVARQQAYSRAAGVTERVDVAELADDALRMHAAAFERHRVKVVREYASIPPVTTDRHKIIQILMNLLQNAKQACDARKKDDRKIVVRIARVDPLKVQVAVSDNGEGIPPENLTRIFSHGFTTKKHGHGFGLHSSALAARELGGSLTALSDGPGLGATFVLELPAHYNADSIPMPDSKPPGPPGPA